MDTAWKIERALALQVTIALFGSALAGCSGSGDGAGGGGSSTASHSSYPGQDLGLPPVAAGYIRYETSPVVVPPGQTGMWAQWVAPPIDGDLDVIDVTGTQSTGGHHAILFATTSVQPVGETRPWQDADQLSTRLVGGVGGEGTAAIKLPAGVVFRIAKGSALMMQTHYLNPTGKTLTGRSVLDVKFGPVDPSAQVASIATSTTLGFSLPAGARTTTQVSCTVQKDLPMLMYANHMHEWGVSVVTELQGADGSSQSIKADPVWDPSWAFDPDYTKFTPQAPSVIPAGSTVSTTCTWSNTTSATIGFPKEMCVFVGFYLGASDVYCVDGKWSESSSTTGDAGVGPG
jgi:hypothetical protein